MEILRLIDTDAIEFTTSVPTASAAYFLTYEDLGNGIIYSASATSLANKTVTFTLDEYYLRYTGSLEATVYDSMQHGLTHLGIDVVRPYCDLAKVQQQLAITNAKAVSHEKIARKIIDAQLGHDILFERRLKETQGQGIDYLPLHERIQKIFTIYENGELLYDADDPDTDPYRISVDKTSVVQDLPQNKLEGAIQWGGRHQSASFPDGYDYLIDGEFGYRVVPEDIQEACELLIQDIESGALNYAVKNIQEFDNREFKIKYAPGFNSGTGNAIVDSLLAVYKNRINAGVF